MPLPTDEKAPALGKDWHWTTSLADLIRATVPSMPKARRSAGPSRRRQRPNH
jgi:hypothetical protein